MAFLPIHSVLSEHSFFPIRNFYFYFQLYVFVCGCMHERRCLQKSEEGIRYLELELDGLEPPGMGAEN